MKVVYNELDVPLAMREDLDTPEWKKNEILKNLFKILAANCGSGSRKPKCVTKMFPIGLLLFKVHERMILVNWWIQLNGKEQDTKWEFYNKIFLSPRTSPNLMNRYDCRNPKAIGRLDSLVLREKRVKESHSYVLLHGGRTRKKVTDKIKLIAHLRDNILHTSKGFVHEDMGKLLKHTEVVEGTLVGIYCLPSNLVRTVTYGVNRNTFFTVFSIPILDI